MKVATETNAAAPLDTAETTQSSTIKNEDQTQNMAKQKSNESNKSTHATQDPAKDSISKLNEDSKIQQGPTPPSSMAETGSSKPIGLGINTEGTTTTSAPGTGDVQNSAIDSLFDIPDNENGGDSDLNFEMDFSVPDSNTQNPSQTQNHDFDLSSFGNNTQDFNMAELTSNDANNGNKQEDIFGNIGGNDSMDLDMDLNLDGAEDSMFNDMYYADDGGLSGGMEHEYDDEFFGIRKN